MLVLLLKKIDLVTIRISWELISWQVDHMRVDHVAPRVAMWELTESVRSTPL